MHAMDKWGKDRRATIEQANGKPMGGLKPRD